MAGEDFRPEGDGQHVKGTGRRHYTHVVQPLSGNVSEPLSEAKASKARRMADDCYGRRAGPPVRARLQ